MGVAAAIIAAAVVSAGAAAYASSASSSAAAKAGRTNARNVDRTNAVNLELFRESRGLSTPSGAVSSLMPYYMDEVGLGGRATDIFNATSALGGTPEEQYARYQAILAGARPGIVAGDQLVQDVLTGRTTDRRLAEAQPTFDARLGVAAGQKEGILEGLMARLNALKADRARQGYTGGGSFDTNRALAFTIPARQAAANTLSEATLANAMDKRSILSAGDELRLRSLDLPALRAQQAITLSGLPLDTISANYARQLKPFEFFRMGPQAFKADPYPQVTPIPGIGQIVASGVGAAANTAGNYYAYQKMLDDYRGALAAQTSYPGAANYNPGATGNAGYG